MKVHRRHLKKRELELFKMIQNSTNLPLNLKNLELRRKTRSEREASKSNYRIPQSSKIIFR